jgi:ribonucleoside-triphosphate reductase (formate)
LNTNKLIDDYINQQSWRIKENSNMTYSYPGMQAFVLGHVNSQYALHNIYNDKINEAHREAFIHVHDLSGLCNYCLGLDFEMMLHQGLHDEDGPPKHFGSALGQLTNLIFDATQEIAGAIAFNSVDVLIAPYIKKDGLTYREVKQEVQSFVYNINEKSRLGKQAPFVNLQLDVTVPKRLQGMHPSIAGEPMPYTYDECQDYAEWFNRAMFETLLESKRLLPFPVLNIGITPEFNWDNKMAEMMFTAMGKLGQPRVTNFVNGPNDPDAVKMMCCSIRLDMSELIPAVGGSFGSADNSGSMGVVTLNLPRYGYLADGNEDILYGYIDHYCDIAANALACKRAFVEEMHKMDMYPVLKRFIPDFRHFFNTIGTIGLNEMCLNMIGKGIDTQEGYELSERTILYINDKLRQLQMQYKDFYGKGHGLIFNHELTPAEGTTYRFAKHDKERYPDIIRANGDDRDFYTRGCWLPVNKEYHLNEAIAHQEKLQWLYTGGADFNVYLQDQIHDWRAVRSLVRKIVTHSKLPMLTVSPTVAVCPICGKLPDNTDWCTHDLSPEQVESLKAKGVELDES